MENASIAAQFRYELELLHDAQEQGLAQSLVNSRTATWPALRKGVEAGRKDSLKNYNQVKKVFAALGLEPRSSRDLGMQGIVDANNEALARTADSRQRDMVVLASAQTAVRYYLGRYKLLRVYAEALGYAEVVKLLTRSIDSIARSDKLIALQDFYFLQRNSDSRSGISQVLLKSLGVLGLIAVSAVLTKRLPASD